MNCAGSERGENSKGFDCRNMGEVLGKECVKDEPFTYSSEEKLREVGEVPAGSNEASENESCKDVSLDPEEDFSWLLSYNSDEFITETCRCEGCLKRNESYNNEKKNAKLMLSSWQDFQNHIKYVYNYPILKDSETPTPLPIEENERLYEMTQILRLCDPYQLFYKIEDEIRSVVLEIQSRHLNLLRNGSNPNLAEEFVAGIIRDYVKLLAGAYLISPAIDFLLKSQLKRFGLSWVLLNKHLYQSLVYAHCEVQENLPQFVSEFKSMQPMSDYHRDIVKQYLLFVDEMALIGADWESVSLRIQEFKNMKTKELETLNILQDALKSFFALKINSVNGVDGLSDPTGKKNSQYCPNCLTMRGCPCDECTVTHILSCEGMDSPPVSDLPVSGSRSPVKDKEVENKSEAAEEEQRSCECHACTVPPPELMDCSVTFSQLTAKNSYGEGFHLYPHIHGTVAENLYEADNMSNIYGNHQTASESVYPHLYNLHNQSNSIPNISQLNRPTAVPNRPQIVQSPSKIQPQPPISPQKKKSLLVSTASENTQPQLPSCPPPLPPPPPQDSPKPAALPKSVRNEKTATENVVVKPVQPKQVPNPSNGGINKSQDVKIDEKKSQTGNKVVPTKESETVVKAVADKTKLLANNKGTACVKSSLCGKCCLRHGPNCLKSPSCGKNTDKHLAAIARLGLTSSTNPRGTVRCAPGKENEHTHKPGKGHSCGKLKSHDISKRTNGKINGQEPDDSSSQDDTCSERSNSTSASAQRDSRHCDCCHCEVFGHGVPSVAPVSRNYQEMRERLRIKLNMKKSAKCKAGPQAPQSDGKAAPGATLQDDSKKNGCGDKDLESLLRFIEGKTREACKDPKRLAKRARQRQKKLEEKERMEEEEAERKRMEAVKRAQAAKQNPPQQTNKQQQHPNNTKNTSNNSKNNSNRNNSNNNHSNNNNNNSSIGNNNSNNKQARNSQTLNLSGLKSLVEKSDPNSGPKMVTIRRVMAPFSAEPTVTITLKGSTPDKDEFLFMLNNGSETYQNQTEEKENNKKSRKKKRKGKKEEEYYEEVEEEPETYYEEEPEPVVEKTGSRKKRKNKNKEQEIVEKSSKSLRSENHHDSSKVSATNVSKNSKHQNSKTSSDNNLSSSGKVQNQSTNKGKSQNTSASVKSQNSSSTQLVVSKAKPQKNVPVLKAQNENVKNRDNSNNSNSKNTFSTKNSSSNSNNTSKNNKNSNNSNNSDSGKGAVRNSVNNVNVVTKNSKTNQKQNVSVSSGNQKSVVNQNGKNQPVSTKQSKSKKSEDISQSSKSQTTQSKAKMEKSKKTGKDVPENVQKVQRKQDMKQSVQEKQRQQESANKSKSNPKPITENRDLCSRFTMGGSYDRGKVVINTPSYRLSEVLSSIAPSPPPKEEINLENLRLPPGITITKIEGPITKSIRVNEQPSHVSKPVPSTPPIVVSTPALKQSHSTPPGNVIVVDTGRLKEVVKENSPNPQPDQGITTGKRKKKKNKQNAENAVPSMEVPMLQTAKCGLKLSKGNPVMTKSGVTVISADEARKMVPNLENQQATIIKTSDNMVTIRSPAFQQAMNMHAYQNSQSFRPGINGYNNVTLFQNDVNRMTDSIGKLNISSEDELARQMRNLDIKEGTRASEIFAQAMAVAGQNGQDTTKKKKKKRKGGGGRSDEKEVEPVESVFQPKDIDLENGDIDDDERELEAFKRFCLQSVPSERKNKVKVNLNIKDIVLKKKSSAIGCS